MKYITNYSRWDNGDFVVTIRPENELPWKDVPIGRALSEKDSKLVSDWLASSLPDLFQIFKNTENTK